MDHIYSYTDYRQFIRDYYERKRSEKKGFSLRVLSDKAGFKARDYLLRVMNGQRNLSKSGIYMLSKALHLSEKESDYFETLVAFNQAPNPAEKEHFFSRLRTLVPESRIDRLREDQFEYFSQWYHCVIRSLLPVMDFKDDFEKIGKFLNPQITSGQAKKSVHLLLRLGLLNRHPDGTYGVSNIAISTGDEVKSVALTQFHKNMIDLGKRAVDICVSDRRDTSGVTMSLSEKGIKKIKTAASEFRKQCMNIAAQDSNEDGVYQVSVNFFPLSKQRKKASA